MEILGKNIGIRIFRNDDVISFFEAATESNEHMQEFMPWCHKKYSVDESEAWVTSRCSAWDNKEEYSFVIFSRSDGELLGGVGINEINSMHKIGNIGYWVRKNALNSGVATEAVSLVSKYGFSTSEFNRLEIVMLPNNVASRKVAEKVGAKYEGILQKRLVVYGKSLDACLYSLVDDV